MKIGMLNADGELKQVVDMTPEEYKKFIFQSGVSDTHGGGKVITMNASGNTTMSVRKKVAIGVLIGLPVFGVIAPLLLKGTRDEKILVSIFGGFAGLILGAGLSVIIAPKPKEV